MNETLAARITALSCWKNQIDIEPLGGGMTNLNFKVSDGDDQFVVRFGEDDPIHLISRANEIASCQAAFKVGVSPELVHHEVPKQFNAVPVMFWVFQVLRHYHNLLLKGDSAHAQRLPELAEKSLELEAAVGPVEIVFGHNDLLPANFIDDGDKIWLIDFDYAGFNSPLFDLSNLASNNELDAAQELLMLQQYFGSNPEQAKLASYHAMKCASLLRETMWSMVSELHSRVDMDFADYTQKNLARFESVYAEYKNNYP